MGEFEEFRECLAAISQFKYPDPYIAFDQRLDAFLRNFLPKAKRMLKQKATAQTASSLASGEGDADGDGFVDEEELKRILEASGLGIDDAQAIMEEFDVSKDGRL